MKQKERLIIATVLLMIAVMVGFDLLTDSKEGIETWHILVEGLIAIIALSGFFYLLRQSILLKRQLENELMNFTNYKVEAEKWKNESRKYIQGLSLAIDQQLSKWNLSVAEKEVAFLLLKGMSIKEIADIRQTAEKTAKVQSMAIYAKSGLSGRSELAAFFLEDLLIPQTDIN